jgi:hypothetical protein
MSVNRRDPDLIYHCIILKSVHEGQLCRRLVEICTPTERDLYVEYDDGPHSGLAYYLWLSPAETTVIEQSMQAEITRV